MNIAYDETEKRSFVRLNLISLGFTLGAIVIAILFIVSVGVVPAVLAFVGLGRVTGDADFAAALADPLRRRRLRHLAALSLRAEPGARQMAMGDLGQRRRHRALAPRLDPVLLVPAELRRLQRHLRIARRRHRLHDVDLDLGGHRHSRRRAEFRDGAPDGARFHHRAGAADGRARRHHGRHDRRKPRRPAAQAGARRAEREPMRFGGENEGMHRATPEERPSRLGTALGFALPLAAIGLRVLLDQRAKSRPGRAARRPEGPVTPHPASVATPRRRRTASRTRRAGSAFGDYLREIDLSGFLARLRQLMAGGVRRIRARLS